MYYLVVNTPIDRLLLVANDSELLHASFLIKEFSNLKNRSNDIINFAINELREYFNGNLKTFKTPIKLDGTNFQKLVWNGLLKIKYGETISYKQLAENINHNKSFRAVANANGVNNLLIFLPCHRVINVNGEIGGYSGGLFRKKWLLNHENKFLGFG